MVDGQIQLNCTDGYYVESDKLGFSGINTTPTTHNVVDGLSTSGLCYTVTTTTTSTEVSTVTSMQTVTTTIKNSIGLTEEGSPIDMYYNAPGGRYYNTVQVRWTATNIMTGVHASGNCALTANGFEYINEDADGLAVSVNKIAYEQWTITLSGVDGWEITNINVWGEHCDPGLSNDPTDYYRITR